ncbi:MAG: hypothetical protein AB7E30_11335, partial [Lawsonibacter sp.]
MKKVLSIIISVCMLAVLAGCGAKAASESAESAKSTESTESTEDYSNTTLVGQVTSIDNTTVVLQLGELTQSQA